jgi:hypothetical protein
MCGITATPQAAPAIRPDPVQSANAAPQQTPQAQGPKGIDQLFNQDRLEKAGGCGQPQNAQQAQAPNEQAQAQQANDPKEALKKFVGALGDILGKVIEAVTGNKGIGDMFKNLLGGLVGGQPQLPAANQAQQ